jgi:hypothetical protein
MNTSKDHYVPFHKSKRANGKTHLLAPVEPLLPTIQSLRTNAKGRDTTDRRRRESGAVGVRQQLYDSR